MDALPPRNAWRVRERLRLPDRPVAEGLIEPGVDALPVRIVIQQDGLTTGWDDGAMGFDADAVWFSGRATSFRILAPDILPGTYACSGVEAVTDAEAKEQGFPLRHPARTVWMHVSVLSVPERSEHEDERRLIQEIKRLRARNDAAGEGQYPPLAPRPGMVPRPPPTSVRVLAGFVALVGLVFVAFISRFLATVYVLVALAAFELTGRQKEQTRALRRIAQEEGT